MKKVLFTLLTLAFLGVNAQTPWYITGNTGTSPSSNFVGTIDEAPLVFKTTGIERMRLLKDKPSLGIGVTMPEATLHLHNPQSNGLIPLLQLTTNATGNAATNGFAVFSDYTTGDIKFKQQEEAKFFIEGKSGGMVIAQDGKIGVGTDAPQATLHINSMDINSVSQQLLQLTTPTCTTGFNVSYNNNTKEITFKQQEGGKFFIEGLNGGFVIAQDGKIGMGTDAPQATLHINSMDINSVSQQLLQLTTPTCTTGFNVFYNRDIKDITFKQQEAAKFFIEGPGGGLAIVQDGKIGMGTVAPKEKVHINDGNLLISATSASTKNVIQMGEGLNSWNIDRLNSRADGYGLHFWVDENGTTGPGERAGSGGSVLFLSSSGKVGVGTKTPTAKFDVSGDFKARTADITNTLTVQSATIADLLTVDRIRVEDLLCAREVKVQIKPCWPDYVFSKNYNLMPLQELEQFVNENQHLPNIPSAAEVEENGIELGEMNAKLLKKVEELTLYLLQQEKKMVELQKQIDELKTTKP